MCKDFTLHTYEQLCKVLLRNNRNVLTVQSYINNEYDPTKPFAIIRHDIDRKPLNALRFAILENQLSIRSTYYFRFPYTFDENIINQIANLKHEIGYHYEVLSKTHGNYEEALGLFLDELSEFRKLCSIVTICMHGSPLSLFDNRDLWKRYDFFDYGIIGDASISITDEDYFTDTGRMWNSKNNMRDYVFTEGNHLFSLNTERFMALLPGMKAPGIYLNVHPHRWASNYGEWSFNYVQDIMYNFGKKMLMILRK